jgi:hypothetical protein
MRLLRSAAPIATGPRASAAPDPVAKAPCGHPGTLAVVIGSAPGVKIGSGSVVGHADQGWMDQVSRAGAGAAAACRPQCGQELVKVSLFLQPSGGITLAQPANDNAGDTAVAQCVAARLKAAAPKHDTKLASSPTGAPGGIVTFAALLEQK